MFNWLYKSKGVKRTLGIIFYTIATVPALAEYSEALKILGAVFGITGIVNAGIDKIVE